MHVAFGYNSVNGEVWTIVSDEPTCLHTFKEYGLRFDIEEAFLDDQSNGWNLQKSEIRSVCALSRLWFLLAVATLYVTAQALRSLLPKDLQPCFASLNAKRDYDDQIWFTRIRSLVCKPRPKPCPNQLKKRFVRQSDGRLFLAAIAGLAILCKIQFRVLRPTGSLNAHRVSLQQFAD